MWNVRGSQCIKRGLWKPTHKKRSVADPFKKAKYLNVPWITSPREKILFLQFYQILEIVTKSIRIINQQKNVNSLVILKAQQYIVGCRANPCRYIVSNWKRWIIDLKSINLSYWFVNKGGFPLIELQTIHKRWPIR